MKSWTDLDKGMQHMAVTRNFKNITQLVIEGVLKLDGKRQAQVDALVEQSSSIEMAMKLVMKSPVGKELWVMAKTAAEDAHYNDFGMQITQDNFEENFPLFV